MNRMIKLLLGICMIAVLFPSCGKEVSSMDDGNNNDSTQVDEHTQHFGVNFNKQLDLKFVRFSELKNSQTTWVRGMMPFFELYKQYKSGKSWYNDPKIEGYKAIHKHGYKTALAIRYFFKNII